MEDGFWRALVAAGLIGNWHKFDEQSNKVSRYCLYEFAR